MAKLIKRNNSKEPKNPKKPIEEIEIGDIVVVQGKRFQVYLIDELLNKRCLVDKYACDYYIKRGEKVEVVNEL